MERAKGFEPSTSCLGSRHSTTELRPRLNLLYDGGAEGVKLEASCLHKIPSHLKSAGSGGCATQMVYTR